MRLKEFTGTYANEFTLDVSWHVLGRTLTLHYDLRGPLDKLILPATDQAPAFRDELWKHACFEAFVTAPDGSGYVELNFSPSGEWAYYAFSDYRQPAAKPKVNLPVEISSKAPGGRILRLEAIVELPFVADGQPLGLTAILEHRKGGLSYWALEHKKEKPDFHVAESFVARLK